MSIKSKGVLERAFMGSTAEHVIREANVPVLSIPVGTGVSQEELASAHLAKP